ncbi:hypothetical protein GCM10020001_119640 [Nonomuraea salmonea]
MQGPDLAVSVAVLGPHPLVVRRQPLLVEGETEHLGAGLGTGLAAAVERRHRLGAGDPARLPHPAPLGGVQVVVQGGPLAAQHRTVGRRQVLFELPLDLADAGLDVAAFLLLAGRARGGVEVEDGGQAPPDRLDVLALAERLQQLAADLLHRRRRKQAQPGPHLLHEAFAVQLVADLSGAGDREKPLAEQALDRGGGELAQRRHPLGFARLQLAGRLQRVEVVERQPPHPFQPLLHGLADGELHVALAVDDGLLGAQACGQPRVSVAHSASSHSAARPVR